MRSALVGLSSRAFGILADSDDGDSWSSGVSLGTKATGRPMGYDRKKAYGAVRKRRKYILLYYAPVSNSQKSTK